MNQNQTFPNELKRIRKQAGLRQVDIAQKLGHTSTDRICHWEKGLAAPSIVNLFKLSIIFGLPAEQLYAGLRTSVADGFKQERDGNDLGSPAIAATPGL